MPIEHLNMFRIPSKNWDKEENPTKFNINHLMLIQNGHCLFKSYPPMQRVKSIYEGFL